MTNALFALLCAASISQTQTTTIKFLGPDGKPVDVTAPEYSMRLGGFRPLARIDVGVYETREIDPTKVKKGGFYIRYGRGKESGGLIPGVKWKPVIELKAARADVFVPYRVFRGYAWQPRFDPMICGYVVCCEPCYQTCWIKKTRIDFRINETDPEVAWKSNSGTICDYGTSRLVYRVTHKRLASRRVPEYYSPIVTIRPSREQIVDSFTVTQIRKPLARRP